MRPVLRFLSRFASRMNGEVLSFVLLTIQYRFWHNIYAFSRSGYRFKQRTLFDYFLVYFLFYLKQRYLVIVLLYH
jgi:hypothetical protein